MSDTVRRIGFMGFTPSRFTRGRPIPVKISFYHVLRGYRLARMIKEHEEWVGYDLRARETQMTLDADSDVTLEACTINDGRVKKTITRDEMKCLMHYIVFFIKDYERKADKINWEMDVNILQNGITYGYLPIRIMVNIVAGTSHNFEDFEEPTAFQTIGKDGIYYGVYQHKCMGVYLEVPLADESGESRCEITISRNADLMNGLSEKDEVAICPTVHVAGNFDGEPGQITLSHCAELSAAALEQNATMFVYGKPDEASEEKVYRLKLSPPECKIEKDKVSFSIDSPGLYTASIKDDLCEGKRVALLAFLPRVMPENRRPILHVNFYYPFGEIGKRIREEWEGKDNVCVKDETTFILMHIGQDMEVTCDKKGNPEPLVSMLETETLDCVPYECVDFELDCNREYTNEVNIKLRVFQEECRSEMEIKQTLTVPQPDPQPDPPEEVEIEVEPERAPSIHLRVPKRVTDQMIGAISSRKIHADRFSVLVNALGFSTKDFGRFVLDNISSAGSRSGYAGTKTLLTRWRNRTDQADQRPELREAFRRSNLPDLTKRYLQVKDDFFD